MTLTDIIALAKQGYKPNDIKELIALADNEPNQNPTPVTPTEEAPNEDEQKELVSQEVYAEPDYKELYLQAQKEKDALTDSLKTAQANNINRDIGADIESPEDVLRKFFE